MTEQYSAPSSSQISSILRAGRAGGYISIVGLFLLLCAIIYSSYTVFSLSREIDQLDKKREVLNGEISSKTEQISALNKLISSSTDQISALNVELNEKHEEIFGLNTQRNKLIDSVNTLNSVIQSKQVSDVTQSTVQKAVNARYNIAIRGYGVSKEKFDQLVNFCNDAGYTVIRANLFNERQKLMAERPTVFYYANEAGEKAREIADNLRRIMGIPFEVKVGGGFGVTKVEERWSIRINFVPG